MKSCLRGCISRGMMACVIASALAMPVLFLSSSPLFAASCASGTDLPMGSTPCTMAVAVAVTTGGLTLANDASATVSNSGSFALTGSDIGGTFNFTSVVKDHEDSAAGWELEASSPGFLFNATTTPFIGSLSLTGQDVGSPATPCTGGTCAVAAAYTPGTIVLTGSAQPFLHAGGGSNVTVVDGNYAYKTDGTFSIPAASAHIGTYTALVSLTLTNSF